MKFFGVLMLCLTAVSGFVAPTPRFSTVVRPATTSTAMRMGLKEDIQKAATVASIAVITAAPALATEGTGEVCIFKCVYLSEGSWCYLRRSIGNFFRS